MINVTRLRRDILQNNYEQIKGRGHLIPITHISLRFWRWRISNICVMHYLYISNSHTMCSNVFKYPELSGRITYSNFHLKHVFTDAIFCRVVHTLKFADRFLIAEHHNHLYLANRSNWPRFSKCLQNLKWYDCFSIGITNCLTFHTTASGRKAL